MTFQQFTAKEYLKIDISNSFGLDKLDWDERIDWFDEHEQDLDKLVPTSKDPALFFAGSQAWKTVKAGKPTGYTISLDGTSSGLQILSALVNCRKSALLCNVVDTGHRENAYFNIYKAMCDEVGESTKIDMDDVKKAID